MLKLNLPQESFVQRRPEGGRLEFTYEGAEGTVRVQCTAGRVNVDSAGPFAGSGRVVVEVLGPGGPYTLTVADDRAAVAPRTLYVGDLWLMAGQSNMEGVGLLAEACEPHPLVRGFSMARRWGLARDPLHVLSESPDPVHSRHASGAPGKGAGVGLPFGRCLVEESGVPQGLIAAAHGGTSMEQWSPDRAGPPGESLYHSALASVRAAGQPLAGVLWFQGCSDTSPEAAALYTPRMVALVQAFRRDLGQPELPWLTVQIGTEIGRTWQADSWHDIQEQQRRLPLSIDRLDVCASADLEHDDWIHVSARAFVPLGRRLASMARRLVLRQDEFPQPQPVAVRWAPDSISPALELECSGVQGELCAPGLPQGFALVDDQGQERRTIYQVRTEGGKIRLRLTDDDLAGVSLFHGLGAVPQINVMDGRGCALPVFGPLPIQGLPPVSPWFRHWHVSEPLPRSVEKIDPRQVPIEGPRNRWEGWNVITLQDRWKGQEQGRLATSWAQVPQAMTVEIVAGGDGPLRVWWDGNEVIHSPEPIADLGTRRTSAPLAVLPGRHEIRVAMTNRGGEAWGFYLRLHRVDANAPLPAEANDL